MLIPSSWVPTLDLDTCHTFAGNFFHACFPEWTVKDPRESKLFPLQHQEVPEIYLLFFLILIGCSGLSCGCRLSGWGAQALHPGRLLLLWSMSASVHGLQELWPMSLFSPWHVGCSWTRDQIHVSGIDRQNSLPLSHQGSTRVNLFYNIQHNIWQQRVIF